MARRGRKPGSPDRAVASPDLRAVGGTWQPLAPEEVQQIAEASISILTDIGMAEAPDEVIETILSHGGILVDGRLRYPRALLDETIRRAPERVFLAGQGAEHDMQVKGAAVYTGTGGAAPNIFDMATGTYRPSTLADLFDAARLADALPQVHFFSRSLVARDIEEPRALDLNTAFAALAGTAKHVMVQASHPEHVADIAALCHAIAGGAAAFRARPFLSLNVNHAVPPLRFHGDSARVIAAAVRAGIPVHCNVFGQLGASSPVTMAGSVAQTLAETLAGLALVHAIDPAAARIAGPRPMITDLRTGGMAGGAGEQAMATAICAQVLRSWNLPSSVIAGATDSKVPDAQAGYEKALNINTAIQAGANLITQAVGVQAGLMAVSFPAMVADNDMLGAILRANIHPEVTPATISLNAIRDVVMGEGHFLGHPETYARMKTDFLYPDIADRTSLEEWTGGPRTDMAQRAHDRAREILSTHHPGHLSRDLCAGLRREFDLLLDPFERKDP